MTWLIFFPGVYELVSNFDQILFIFTRKISRSAQIENGMTVTSNIAVCSQNKKAE
jgi:hypothetical protein